MTKVKWQDHFKSAIQDADNLYSKDSTDVSLLMFCLRSKLLSEADYLAWAKENFQIPLLSKQFFQIHKPQIEFYKKWQKIHKWSAECLPIAEWDGVLIIACLEFPESYQNANPTAFVLTSHEILDQTWATYNQSEKSLAAESAGISDYTDMTALAATVVAPSKEVNFFDANGELVLKDEVVSEEEHTIENAEAQKAAEEAGIELSAESEAASMPEGLFGDAAAPSMEPLTNFTKTEPIPLQPMNIEVTTEIPLNATPEIVAEIETPKKGPRSVETLLSLDDKTSIDEVAPLDELEEVHDHEVQFPDKKQISPVAQATPGNLPSAPVKSTTNPASTAAYYLEKVRKQGQENFDKEVISSFQQMKTFFKKSMLLAVGDKDLLIKPILWDGSFDVQTPAKPEFNLKTPSLFKIVSGTQKPYHGYIVPNDLNESFFESWNHGQIPDHVTLVPLMDGDHVVGMIMGFGEKASYNKNVLQFTEDIAKGLSNKIMKPAAVAKAA